MCPGPQRNQPIPLPNPLVLSGIRDVLQHCLHIRLPHQAPLHLRLLPPSPFHRLPEGRLRHQTHVLQRGVVREIDIARAGEQHRPARLRGHPADPGPQADPTETQR